MTAISWIYAICSFLCTVCITGFACFALIDYFRLRRYVKKKTLKEMEDISIDVISSEVKDEDAYKKTA